MVVKDGVVAGHAVESGPVELFPINPKQLARYRDALYPSGGKDDPVDAELAARFLIHHRDRLRSPWDISFPAAMMWGVMGCVAGFAVSIVSRLAPTGWNSPPGFERKQLGDAARLGQCTSVEGNVKGDAVHLVACVTTVRNRNQETLLHSLTWVLPAEDFAAREEEVWEAVANLSSAWFRVSDLNAKGTLRHGW